jgi:Protein of unknown function (DUF4238)
MSRGSKDHFVPCGYLRHFATEDSKTKNSNYRRWQVHAYNRTRDEKIQVPVRIDSVANSKLFEHFDGDEKVNSEIKGAIRQRETSFFHVQSEIAEKKSMNGFTDNMLNVIDFVAFQRERTQFRRNLYKLRLKMKIESNGDNKRLSQHGRESLKQQTDILVPLIKTAYLKKIANLNLTEENKSLWSEKIEKLFLKKDQEIKSGLWDSEIVNEVAHLVENKQVLQNYHLSNSFRFAYEFSGQLKNCSWVMFRNKTKQPLWTSDNPVVAFLNPLFSRDEPEWLNGVFDDLKILSGIIDSSSPLNKDGSVNKDFCLLFPLSPQIIFQVEAYDAAVGFRYGEADIKDEDHINKLNFYQFACTSRNIYSSNNNFDLIPDMKRYIRDTSDKVQNFPDKLQEIIDGIKVNGK